MIKPARFVDGAKIMRCAIIIFVFAIASYSSLGLEFVCHALPKLKAGAGVHEKSKQAAKFMRKNRIDSVEQLRHQLHFLKNNNVNYWNNLANAFRHARGGNGCAQLIYLRITGDKSIYPRQRSFSYIGLSKIAQRHRRFDESVVFAEKAVAINSANGFAWLRLGDSSRGGSAKREKSYNNTLVIAKSADDKFLKLRAYLGLSNVYRLRNEFEHEQHFLLLAKEIDPNDVVVRRRIARLLISGE